MTLTAHRDDPNPYTNQAVWVDFTREDSAPSTYLQCSP